MMKFFTIILVLYYINMCINQNKTMRKLLRKFGEKDIEEIFEREKNLDLDEKEYFENIFKLIVVIFVTALVEVIEVIYLFYAYQHLNIYIWMIYMLFWLSILIYRKIKAKNSKGKLYLGVLEYNVKQLIINIVDLVFFTYMFVILFK